MLYGDLLDLHAFLEAAARRAGPQGAEGAGGALGRPGRRVPRLLVQAAAPGARPVLRLLLHVVLQPSDFIAH